MDPYLSMWGMLHAGDAGLAALWGVAAIGALRRRDRWDAVVWAVAAVASAVWLTGEAALIHGGGLVSDAGASVRITQLGWVALALLALGRRTVAGRGPLSMLPLGLGFQDVVAGVAGLALTGRGVMERLAPARRWAVIATVLFLVAAGVRHHRIDVRSAMGNALDLSLDERVVATEWVADAAELGAWGAAAWWAARSRSS